jgi:hypothetical protein
MKSASEILEEAASVGLSITGSGINLILKATPAPRPPDRLIEAIKNAKDVLLVHRFHKTDHSKISEPRFQLQQTLYRLPPPIPSGFAVRLPPAVGPTPRPHSHRRHQRFRDRRGNHRQR